MLDKIKGVVAGGVDIGVMLIGLAIVLQIVFGGSAFLRWRCYWNCYWNSWTTWFSWTNWSYCRSSFVETI